MLSTNLIRHCASGGELLAKFPHDDRSAALGHPIFGLFFAIDDVPAAFLPDTVAQAFHQAALAEGRSAWRGAKIAPERITKTGLLTIEGGRTTFRGQAKRRLSIIFVRGYPPNGVAICSARTGQLGLFFGWRWRQEVLEHVSRLNSGERKFSPLATLVPRGPPGRSPREAYASRTGKVVPGTCSVPARLGNIEGLKL